MGLRVLIESVDPKTSRWGNENWIKPGYLLESKVITSDFLLSQLPTQTFEETFPQLHVLRLPI